MRELRHFPADTARRWIGRIPEWNFLASILATEALYRLSRVASHLGDQYHEFPERGDKRHVTQMQGDYWIEYEVPEGAALEHGDVRLDLGYRSIALVQRCHLSQHWYDAPL